MTAVDLARTSLASLASHPLRSMLTALGSVIGVAAVVILLAVGLGAQRKVAAAIETMGSDLIVVTPTFRPSSTGGLLLSLRDGDVKELRERVSHARGVTGLVQLLEQISAGGETWSARLLGIDEDYDRVQNVEIASGRPLESEEIRRGRRSAVIGSSVAAALFPNADPLGESLQIRRTRYEIVGILRSRGTSPSGDDLDNIVLVPLRSARLRIGGLTKGGNSIHQIYVMAAGEEAIDDTMGEIGEVLREQHRLRPTQEDDFQVRKATAALEIREEASRTFTILLVLLGAVSLGIGGIGIMNIMLVSVAERRQEIGLRMAVGAARRDIALQFLCEAITLSVGGGVVGILLGFLGVMIAGTAGWDTSVPFWIPLAALAISVAVGAASGTYPAWKAGRLYPMESLRNT